MKKAILIATTFFVAWAIQAQVTIKKSSVISAGHEFMEYSDTTSLTIQQGGTGHLNWDLKNLRFDDSTVMLAQNSDWVPSISNLAPGSNVIIKEKGKEDYTLLDVNDTSVRLIAGVRDTGTGPLEVNRIGMNFLRYPITHDGNVYSDTTLMWVQQNYLGIKPGPGAPLIDSIRAEFYAAQEFRAIGHGKIDFPQSSVPNVLMIENLNSLYTHVYALTGGNWINVTEQYGQLLGYEVGPDTSYRHTWWTDDNGKGLPVVQYDFDQGDTKTEDVSFSPAPAQLSTVRSASKVQVTVYPNPSADKIEFQGINNLNANVNIYAVNGALISRSNLVNGVLDVSDLKTGNYIIHVQSGNDIVVTEITKE